MQRTLCCVRIDHRRYGFSVLKNTSIHTQCLSQCPIARSKPGLRARTATAREAKVSTGYNHSPNSFDVWHKNCIRGSKSHAKSAITTLADHPTSAVRSHACVHTYTRRHERVIVSSVTQHMCTDGRPNCGPCVRTVVCVWFGFPY